MPSTFSQNGLELQAAGEHLNTWGSTNLNNTLKRANYLISGYQAVTVNDGTNTLTSSNSSTSQSDFQGYNALIKLVAGTITTNFSVVVPSVSMRWSIWNATSKSATITTGSGATVTVETGDIIPVECFDGTNIETVSYGGLALKDYIAAQVIGVTGALPAVTGNAGKFIYTDGTSSFWKAVAIDDFSDYASLILGVQVALAVSL